MVKFPCFHCRIIEKYYERGEVPLIHEHLYTSYSRAEFYRFQMECCFRDAKHCGSVIVKEVVTSREAHRMTQKKSASRPCGILHHLGLRAPRLGFLCTERADRGFPGGGLSPLREMASALPASRLSAELRAVRFPPFKSEPVAWGAELSVDEC